MIAVNCVLKLMTSYNNTTKYGEVMAKICKKTRRKLAYRVSYTYDTKIFEVMKLHAFYENRRMVENGHLSVWIYENQNFNYLAHWHPEIEMVWVESGTIEMGINHEVCEMHAGALCFCRSGDIHYYKSISPESKVAILVCRVDCVEGLSEWLEKNEIESLFMSGEDVIKFGIEDVYRLFQEILQEDKNKRLSHEIQIKALSVQLFIHLMRNWPSHEDQQKKVQKGAQLILLQRILIFIEENITGELSLEYLSEVFKIDPFYLSKLFNRATGMNFKMYINTIRVFMAEEMLKNSDKLIIEIAYEAGFNSLRNFNRVYKSIKGMPPSSIRARNQ